MSEVTTRSLKTRLGFAKTRLGFADDESLQYKPGDFVMLDFGISGTLGPGIIEAKVEFSDGWEGYQVRVLIDERGDEEAVLGWLGPSLLRPASPEDDALGKRGFAK